MKGGELTMKGLLDPEKFDPEQAARVDREERAGMEALDAEARGDDDEEELEEEVAEEETPKRSLVVTELEYDDKGRVVKITEEPAPE